jgi:hypothetical protein
MSAEGGILREIELAIRGIDKAKLKNLSIAYEQFDAKKEL